MPTLSAIRSTMSPSRPKGMVACNTSIAAPNAKVKTPIAQRRRVESSRPSPVSTSQAPACSALSQIRPEPGTALDGARVMYSNTATATA